MTHEKKAKRVSCYNSNHPAFISDGEKLTEKGVFPEFREFFFLYDEDEEDSSVTAALYPAGLEDGDDPIGDGPTDAHWQHNQDY